MRPTRVSAFALCIAVLAMFPVLADGPGNHRDTSQYTVGSSIQPLVIIGEGWTQQFTFINVDYYDSEPTIGTLSFYTKDGQPWRIPLRGRGLADRVSISLKAGQMMILDTEVSWQPQQLGWASLELSENTKEWGIYRAFTVYRKQTEGRPDLMTSVPFVDALEDEWIVPFDNEDGKFPGVCLLNASPSSRTTFMLEVYDINGNNIKTLSKTLGPRALNWFSLVDENPELANKRGQIKVSGGLFRSAVFTLQFSPNGAFTGLPVVHTFGMR